MAESGMPFTLGRRMVLAGLLCAPVPALAQPGRTYRVAVLEWEPQAGADGLAAFRQSLHSLGFVEGANLHVDIHFAGGRLEIADVFAQRIVASRPDAIVAVATPAAHAARRATADIPIVFSAADPVGTGLVTNLARPGGNVTGVSLMMTDLEAKRLDLLREALPAAMRIAYLGSARDPASAGFLAQVRKAGTSHGLDIEVAMVDGPDEVDARLGTLAATGVDAVIIQPLFTISVFSAGRVAESTLRHRIAAIGTYPPFAHAGGLLSFGPPPGFARQRAAQLVARILSGANPGDLPVEQPTGFHLVVNLATARHLGIAIPPLLLARADEVIE
ncbi:MAG: ABC transporter substrate-binding protein [Acetobacteraceae bacterium]|nr:ABC transporter substrate-binding protein [Acetobacteraceae bacterium]